MDESFFKYGKGVGIGGIVLSFKLFIEHYTTPISSETIVIFLGLLIVIIVFSLGLMHKEHVTTEKEKTKREEIQRDAYLKVKKWEIETEDSIFSSKFE